ncbi:sigma 54-interacting transcriptional regulator [Microbacterium sp. NPDC056569]|uniref:sigma 54-interacting transcriptional regulator n=1 Tax=Microbacterium sp. NPDC056569 TaxID=3345867 RepID=UPI003671C33F
MSSAPSRSSQDAVGNSLGIAVEQIVAAIAQVAASNPVVLIDGRSGAGKTSLARALVARWPLRGRVQLVALDSIYPGWDGLDDGVELARELILTPHARGLVGVWQRWDWTVGEPAEAHAVDPSLPLIVEGAGVLTPTTARLADVLVWLESPAASRKQRALARDGETYRPHWDRWARQEQRHVARDDPMGLATLVFPVP